MKKEKPDFKIGETAMYVWATELKDDDHLAEAIDVLKLELQIYPDSSDAYERLGRDVSEVWGEAACSREL